MHSVLCKDENDDYVGFIRAPRAAHPCDVSRDIYIEHSLAALPEYFPHDAEEWSDVNLIRVFRYRATEVPDYENQENGDLRSTRWEAFQEVRTLPILERNRVEAHLYVPAALPIEAVQVRVDDWTPESYQTMIVAMRPNVWFGVISRIPETQQERAHPTLDYGLRGGMPDGGRTKLVQLYRYFDRRFPTPVLLGERVTMKDIRMSIAMAHRVDEEDIFLITGESFVEDEADVAWLGNRPLFFAYVAPTGEIVMLPPHRQEGFMRGGGKSRDKRPQHAMDNDTSEKLDEKEWVRKSMMVTWALGKTKKNAPQYPPQLISLLMKAEPRNIQALHNANSQQQTEHIAQAALARAGISSHFMGKEREDEIMKHIEALRTAIQHQQQVLQSLVEASMAGASVQSPEKVTLPPEILKQSILETKALDSLTMAVVNMEKKMETWETTFLAEVADRLPLPTKSEGEDEDEPSQKPPKMSMRFGEDLKRTQEAMTASPSDKPVSSVLDAMKEKSSKSAKADRPALASLGKAS